MDKINPHNNDFINSIFIRDFLGGGAHCFLAFLPIYDSKVSGNCGETLKRGYELATLSANERKIIHNGKLTAVKRSPAISTGRANNPSTAGTTPATGTSRAARSFTHSTSAITCSAL
jgi:hypothetical protein